MTDTVDEDIPGLSKALEKGGQEVDSEESFSKDKDISELLEFLSQMKDREGLKHHILCGFPRRDVICDDEADLGYEGGD